MGPSLVKSSTGGSQIELPTIPSPLLLDDSHNLILNPSTTTRFELPYRASAIRQCALSTCSRYLIVVTSDSLTVHDKGCNLSGAAARERQTCSVQADEVGCVEVRGIGDAYWIYIGSGSRLQLLKPPENGEEPKFEDRIAWGDSWGPDASLPRHTVHDHTQTEEWYVDRHSGESSTTGGPSVTGCVAPSIAIAPNTVISVAGESGSIHCTFGGTTVVTPLDGVSITAAGCTPNGQGAVFGTWNSTTGRSQILFLRMPTSRERQSTQLCEEEAGRSECCKSPVVSMSFSVCGSVLVVGTEAGDVLVLCLPDGHFNRDNERELWKGMGGATVAHQIASSRPLQSVSAIT